MMKKIYPCYFILLFLLFNDCHVSSLPDVSDNKSLTFLGKVIPKRTRLVIQNPSKVTLGVIGESGHKKWILPKENSH